MCKVISLLGYKKARMGIIKDEIMPEDIMDGRCVLPSQEEIDKQMEDYYKDPIEVDVHEWDDFFENRKAK